MSTSVLSSYTSFDESYPSSKTASNYSFGDNFVLTSVFLAATITTASATLPSPLIADSSVFYQNGLHLDRSSETSIDYISRFTSELFSRSRSMTDEEASLIKNMLLAKSKPGIPKF